MNRGNRKAQIFEDDRDRRRFLRILIEEQETYGVQTLAGTLMANHFHLAVVTPHGNLSDFMEQLQGRFARYTNWRHNRVGHLFQGRFRHVYIESDIHLLTALCYIFMNAVTAGLVRRLEDYRWSSYAATVGCKSLPSYLSIGWLETLFPGLSMSEAQQQFKKLMSEPKPAAAYVRQMELNVSPETIRQVIRSFTGEQLQIATLPRVYRTALRPPLNVLFEDVEYDPFVFVREARVTYGYTSAEIAKTLGVSRGRVSQIYCRERADHLVPGTY